MITDLQFTDERWLEFWANYKALPHQKSALSLLAKHIRETDPGLLTDSAEWVDAWRSAPPAPAKKRFTPQSSFSYKITPNITYGEVACQSETRRFVAQHQCDTAILVCEFAQKARDHFNKPVVITSGYRPPKINAQVGGAVRSEHLYDAPSTGAIDFYLDGMSVRELQDWADVNWPYSLGYGAPKGFIHVGVRPGRPRVRWVY